MIIRHIFIDGEMFAVTLYKRQFWFHLVKQNLHILRKVLMREEAEIHILSKIQVVFCLQFYVCYCLYLDPWKTRCMSPMGTSSVREIPFWLLENRSLFSLFKTFVNFLSCQRCKKVCETVVRLAQAWNKSTLKNF